ncbi:MAG: abortive infection family protein [Gammaproteobacteria bacterium]|nr:abortive infection family protein [Gammaproteobacteria bacterium]
MIFKDLFGQKEENEKKSIINEKIPINTRQKISFVIMEYGFHAGPFNLGDRVNDLNSLRYQICKHKGIPNINDEILVEKSINKWLLKCSVIDFLRTIEIFIYIKEKYRTSDDIKIRANVINEINDIFRIDRIGYEIVNGKIIIYGSEYLNDNVTKQTISLLNSSDFKGPLEEFEKALNHYLKKEYKDTIQEANNSFESTMKSILTKLGIKFDPQVDNASKLLQILYDNDVIYIHTQEFTNNLKKMLQGLPTIRNKQSGHGQGLDSIEIYKSYAGLSLHLAGSFIVFLINRYDELK